MGSVSWESGRQRAKLARRSQVLQCCAWSILQQLPSLQLPSLQPEGSNTCPF